MRQATTYTRVSAVVTACTALLAACGGSDSSGGTVQSIDFAYPGPHYMLDAPVPLKATASSGLPVTFTSNTPTICTVVDGSVVPVATGECSVTATQDGDSTYTAAAPAQQLFNILPHTQAIDFPSPGFQDITAATTVTLSATATSGLPVSFDSTTPEVCTVTGTTLNLVSMGTCSIDAEQDGDATYGVAKATNKFTVGDSTPPVLTFVSGFTANGTVEGANYDGYAGSNLDGWWCSDPTWCSRDLSTDGLSFTMNYFLQTKDPNHPNHDNGVGAYVGLEVFAPGLKGFVSDGDTTTGMQIGKQSTMKLNVALDPLWYSTIATGKNNADIKVTFDMGHFVKKPKQGDPDPTHYDACNIAIQAIFTPSGAAAHTYELSLDSFKAISNSCGLAGIDPVAELANYTIVRIHVEAATANQTVSSSTDPAYPTYPTTITVTAPVTFQ